MESAAGLSGMRSQFTEDLAKTCACKLRCPDGKDTPLVLMS